MMNPGNEIKSSWRDNWVIKKFIELPIFGSFIKHSNTSEAFHDAGKCVAMLGGGSIAMMMFPVDAEHSGIVQGTEMAGKMAIGGFIGKTVYIETCNAAGMLYQFANRKCRSEYCELAEERQSVHPTPHSSKNYKMVIPVI